MSKNTAMTIICYTWMAAGMAVVGILALAEISLLFMLLVLPLAFALFSISLYADLKSGLTATR